MRSLSLVLLLVIIPANSWGQTTREQKVRDDKQKNEASGFWHYNNFAKGIEDAKITNKPIMVVLRCLPCDECVKLDDELVEKDSVIKPLLEKFVRVRIVGTNGLDLSLFQFDYDQSFAILFFNADGTIYGRYGTRSHRTNWVDDVSIKGLAAAMQSVLKLHEGFPASRNDFINKKGIPFAFSTPEQFPLLKTKYTSKLVYEGKVVQSCIHCHQIGEAIKQYAHTGGAKISEELLFPYPHPKVLGFIFDPSTSSVLLEVKAKSFADTAGFKSGDLVVSFNNQPIVSIADVQWVLNSIPTRGGNLSAVVLRKGENVSLKLDLPQAWRRQDDISWRSSSWEIRRMVLGGMLLENIPSEELKTFSNSNMALRVKHVGQFGPHAAAHKAGVIKGDILLAFDGKSDLIRETDIFYYALSTKKIGDSVALKLQRKGKILELKIPIQGITNRN